MNQFKADLDDCFRPPTNEKRLAAAAKANDAFLLWEKSGTMKNWKRFIRLYCKITEVEGVSLDVCLSTAKNETVFDYNITHNLNKMAGEAGIYKHLWRPDEIGISKASQLIEPLTKGLQLLQSDPDRFRQFNPANGWGDYEGLVQFVSSYLIACVKYPDAEINISR